MFALLEAIHNNHAAYERGEDYTPFSKDILLGREVIRYKCAHHGTMYKMSHIVATANAAGINISESSLYRAAQAYRAFMRPKPKARKGRRPN